MRELVYEAATVFLTRSRVDSDLRAWGLKLRERLGLMRAAVAVARKLGVAMHAMLRSSQSYRAKAAIASPPEHLSFTRIEARRGVSARTWANHSA